LAAPDGGTFDDANAVNLFPVAVPVLSASPEAVFENPYGIV
jgi:hypothetical protein